MEHKNSVLLKEGALLYRLDHRSFLTESQAAYALRRIWELVDGAEVWDGPALVEIPAANTQQVLATFEPSWQADVVTTAELLPANGQTPSTFASLPLVFPNRGKEASRDYPQDATVPVFPMDVVAFAFVMLSRWEEHERVIKRDDHGRAVRTSMLAARNGFDHRPIIDQWALILKAWLFAADSRSVTETPHPTIRMTHDVDRPIRFTKASRVLRGCVGELVFRSHSLSKTASELVLGIRSLRDFHKDPYYQRLRQFMDWNERVGLRGCFYLMTSAGGAWDDGYDLQQTPFCEILNEIQERGHEVGWHPGYDAAVEPERFHHELDRIRQAVGPTSIGGRHHYLRWQPGTSWELWDDAGLSYDSSLGFADTIGFRCGTSRPFPVFSHTRQEELSLVERPLAVMEGALEIGFPEPELAKKKVSELLAAVAEVGGEAVLLMHNCFTNAPILAAITDSVEECGLAPADRRRPLAA